MAVRCHASGVFAPRPFVLASLSLCRSPMMISKLPSAPTDVDTELASPVLFVRHSINPIHRVRTNDVDGAGGR